MGSIDKHDFYTELQGTELRIPNLDTIMSPLATGSSPHSQYEILVELVNSRLDELIKDSYVRERVNKINLPLFIARWWPYSIIQRQEAMALYILWLFVWDDTFDCGEDGVEVRPSNMDETYKKTINYVAYHLGLTDPSMGEPATPTIATALFQHAGQLLQEQLVLFQRQRLFDEMKFYINSCAIEQKYLDSGILPSVDEYWLYRLGTSAVYPLCALAEYMADIELPVEVLEMPEVRALWTEVNHTILLTNDLFSLKKEIHGSLHSLIPITMQDTGKDLDSVVTDIVDQLRRSVDRFGEAARALLKVDMVDSDPDLKETVIKYIQLLEFNVTGDYSWSRECARYNATEDIQRDGSFVITL